MRGSAIIGFFLCLASSSVIADDAIYIAAQDRMVDLVFNGDDLDEATNRLTANCYLAWLNPEDIVIISNAGTADEIFEVIENINDAAVDCENEIADAYLGAD